MACELFPVLLSDRDGHGLFHEGLLCHYCSWFFSRFSGPLLLGILPLLVPHQCPSVLFYTCFLGSTWRKNSPAAVASSPILMTPKLISPTQAAWQVLDLYLQCRYTSCTPMQLSKEDTGESSWTFFFYSSPISSPKAWQGVKCGCGLCATPGNTGLQLWNVRNSLFRSKPLLRYQWCYSSPHVFLSLIPVMVAVTTSFPQAGELSHPRSKPGLNRQPLTRCTLPSAHPSPAALPRHRAGPGRSTFVILSQSSDKDTEHLYVKKELLLTARMVTLIGQDSKKGLSHDSWKKFLSEVPLVFF